MNWRKILLVGVLGFASGSAAGTAVAEKGQEEKLAVVMGIMGTAQSLAGLFVEKPTAKKEEVK